MRLNGIPTMKISDLRFFGSGLFHCFIPKQFLPQLKDDISAVFLKNSLNLKSLYYTRKKYVDNRVYKVEHDESHELLFRITRYIEQEITILDSELRSIDFHEEHVRSIAVDSTLTRLAESYEAAIFLINNIFYFESFSIIRLIFEQLVFCINICDMSDEEYSSMSKNKLKKQLSSTNIHKIKKLFPEQNLGSFYKYLSGATHVGVGQAAKFVTYDYELNRVTVSRTVRMAIDAAFHLLKVLDIHRLTFEYSLKEYLPLHLKNKSIDSDTFKALTNRKIKSQAIKFNEEFKLLKTV